MRILCTQENLFSAVTIVSHIASQSGTLPILSNILIKAENGLLTLCSTDLEIGISISVRGKVEQDGSFTVNSRVFSNIIGFLPKENVEITLKDSVLYIVCGGAKTKINGIEATDFPIIPSLDTVNGIRVDAGVFKKALTQAITAVSQDEGRVELTGVLFSIKEQQFYIVATDSYRLVERKIPILTREGAGVVASQVIVPLKTARELLRSIDDTTVDHVGIYVVDGQIQFMHSDVRLVSRLIEGNYPDYDPIIPKSFQTMIEIDRDSLLRASKSAGIFTQTGVNGITLQFNTATNELLVASMNTQLGENLTTIPVQGTGVDNKIVFDYRYLTDGLNTIESPTITLGMNNAVSPGILKQQGRDDYLYIIMPIRS